MGSINKCSFVILVNERYAVFMPGTSERNSSWIHTLSLSRTIGARPGVRQRLGRLDELGAGDLQDVGVVGPTRHGGAREDDAALEPGLAVVVELEDGACPVADHEHEGHGLGECSGQAEEFAFLELHAGNLAAVLLVRGPIEQLVGLW